MTNIFSDIPSLWEEITTSFTFCRATDTEDITPIRYMRRRLEKVIFDITGEPAKNINLEHFKPIREIPYHSKDNWYCNDVYTSRYTDPYEIWEKETDCYDCAGTEFCLCGHVIWYRYFLKHRKSKKILLLGSCCIRRISPELADSMEKAYCYNGPECKEILSNKNHLYEQEGFCSLKCLEQKEPEHPLIKKCKGCRAYLYPPSIYKQRKVCFRSCQLGHKVFILKLEKLYINKFFQFEERTRRFELEKRKEDELKQRSVQEEYKRNLMDPSVTLLCDCEKYYIPYKNRINCKDPICLVCKTKKDKRPINQSLLKWMADHDLVHSEI